MATQNPYDNVRYDINRGCISTEKEEENPYETAVIGPLAERRNEAILQGNRVASSSSSAETIEPRKRSKMMWIALTIVMVLNFSLGGCGVYFLSLRMGHQKLLSEQQAQLKQQNDELNASQAQIAESNSNLLEVLTKFEAVQEQMNAFETRIVEQFTGWKNLTESKLQLVDDAIVKNTKAISLLIHDCEAIEGESGITRIKRKGRSYQVYCDMATDGGNWIVFQRRVDGSVDFYRNWEEYASGFGNPNGEFWLGLETIYQLTQDGNYELRVDLTDWDGSTAYAKYTSFSITARSDGYRLTVSGYEGNAGNSLSYHSGERFTTKDKDLSGHSCGTTRYAAWWFDFCAHASLNGRYNDTSASERGVFWRYWGNRDPYSLKGSEMKFRKK